VEGDAFMKRKSEKPRVVITRDDLTLDEGNLDPDQRFDILVAETKKFCKAVGLPKGLIGDIFRTDSDWAFILQTDALLETACKEILRHSLRLHMMRDVIRNDTLDQFVDALPMNGRTSLLKLLEAADCPPEDLGFIEATRKLRNAYAHTIHYVDLTLVELIKKRPDKSDLIKKLCAIQKV
jgi:hypothetical protein